MAPYLLGGQSHHADDFIPAAVAGRNGNGRSRHLQKLCEEFDAGLIGAALNGRHGEREFNCVSQFPSDRALFRVRMNSDSEGNTPVAVLDGNHGRMLCNSEARGRTWAIGTGGVWRRSRREGPY